MTADQWIERGEELFELSKYSEAEAAFAKATAIEPQDALAWNNLGIALRNQDKYIEAEEAFRCATEFGPEDAGAWTGLGDALDEQKRYAEAQEAYQCAVEIDPQNARAWNYLGFVLRNRDKYSEAEKAFKRAVDIDCQYVRAWYGLGFALRSQDKYSEAEMAYQRAVDIDSKYAHAWNNLGDALNQQNKYVEAEKAFRRAIDIDPKYAFAWCNLGVVLGHQEKHADAEMAYKRAIDIDPLDADYWYNLGNALHGQDRYAGAEEAYKRAIDFDPQYADAWNNLGVVLGYQNKYGEAEEAYKRAIDINPQYSFPWNNLGNALDDQDKYAEAESPLRRAIDIDPQYAFAWNNLGVALRNQDKYGEAEEAYQRAADIDPQYAEAWENLGEVLLDLSKYVEAEEAGRRVITLRANHYLTQRAWNLVAAACEKQESPPARILSAYRHMARAVEGSRLDRPRWEDRLEAFRSPAVALQRAAVFCARAVPRYSAYALSFAVQSKARTLGELLDHDPGQLRELLLPPERARLDILERATAALEMERHGWDMSRVVSYGSAGLTTKRLQAFHSAEQERQWREKQRDLDQERDTFLRKLVLDNPELEPFVLGPRPRSFRFSLARLQRRLRHGEAVLELLRVETGETSTLLGFLVTQDGLIKTHHWDIDDPMDGQDGPTLGRWQQEVDSTLYIDQDERAMYIKKNLTEDVLARWGQLLYGRFIDALSGVHRLWVSPHSFLTQLPFNAIPFPDGVKREVAVIPSAASLLQSKRRGPRPKPRFTLGVMAADSMGRHLDLNGEEARHLRGTVRSARRRWELAGNRPGEDPTLANLQERVGLTKCLVLSCHGDGPNGDWGTLALGTRDRPEPVTGRRLVDSFLLGGRLRGMEVDLVITSACLTGQVNLERAEEWLGLPLALQAVWKTKAMLLTLWEVEELPSMNWVVELVRGLTAGVTVGEAQKQAQEKVRTVTRGEVEGDWLSEAQ